MNTKHGTGVPCLVAHAILVRTEKASGPAWDEASVRDANVLGDLEAVAARAREVVELIVLVELEVLDLHLVVEHRHLSGSPKLPTLMR